MKAIVLCGGFGTRLGELTKNTPKPLLEVAGRPFISYVLDLLVNAGAEELVLAAGFQSGKLQDFVGDGWLGTPVRYSIESEPLGTGGAIKKAMVEGHIDRSLVVNGDTLFDIDIPKFVAFAGAASSVVSVALRGVEDCARFGRVAVDMDGRVVSFGEKGHAGPGLINGGIYFLHKSSLEVVPESKFSFESEVLQARHSQLRIFGQAYSDYFIDIGVPEDLGRAKNDFLNFRR